MPPDIVEHVVVWSVWFSHSDCVACSHWDDTEHWYYDAWSEAAVEIEAWLVNRKAGCRGEVIVDRVLMPKPEHDALVKEEPCDAS